MNPHYDPRIALVEPFPRLELPTLYVWTQKARRAVADDSVPRDLDEFMHWHMEREFVNEINTWAAYKDGELGGYFEATLDNKSLVESLDPTLRALAQVQCVFKRDVLWAIEHLAIAMNLVLQELFVKENTSLVCFPAYRHQ